MTPEEIERDFLENHPAVKMMSALRQARYGRTLAHLHRHSAKQWEVYVRCVLGQQPQARIAQEWSVSRPAIFKLKAKAEAFVGTQMGWEAEIAA